MPRYALALEMDGAAFAGTALQAGRPTLTAALRAALAVIHNGTECLTRTSGRLDAGVSARWLVAHAMTPRAWPDCRSLAKAINAHLPAAAVVVAVAVVDDDWDALAQASMKTYHYQVYERAVRPTAQHRWYHCRRLACAEHLPACASLLIGHHCLAAFACRRSDGSDPEDTRRTIQSAMWWQEPVAGGRLWTFAITGSGFLYKQVRGVVGAQLAVARGKAEVGMIRDAIGAGFDHPPIGSVAPAAGLVLDQVRYAAEPDWLRL